MTSTKRQRNFPPAADAVVTGVSAASRGGVGLTDAIQADAVQSGCAADTPSDTYTVRSWGSVCDAELPSRRWFWGETFAAGQTQAMIGQGGLGKSRISLNLARNQVLGLSFGGMPTGGAPMRHLLMGSENDLHRLSFDCRYMTKGLKRDQRDLLTEHIFMATIEKPEDGFMSLGDPSNHERWARTIAAFKPDVLWIDPWGDVVAGDANSDSDTRQTISALIRLARQCVSDCGIVFLHHSRTGAQNIRQAVGFDGANFGKNSKSLFSSCRAVVNLAPADETENPAIVVACAKNNNGRRFETFSMCLDEDTMTYDLDPTFDLDAWQADVTAAANGKRGKAVKAEPFSDHYEAIRDLCEERPMPSGTLHNELQMKINRGEKYVKSLVNDALHNGVIAKTARRRESGGRVLIGLPEGVRAIEDCTNPHKTESGS